MKYIVAPNYGEKPAQYADYLNAQADWAKKTLARPNEKWPRGMSHAIARSVLLEVESARIDLATEHGRWNASGQLVGFE